MGTRIHLCPAASHGHEVPTRTPVVPVGTRTLPNPCIHHGHTHHSCPRCPNCPHGCTELVTTPVTPHAGAHPVPALLPDLPFVKSLFRATNPALCSGPPAGNGLWGRDGAVPAPRRQDPALGPRSHLDAAVAPVGHDDVAIGVDSHPRGGVELPVPLPVRPELEEELTVRVVHLGTRVSLAAGTGPGAQRDGHGAGHGAGTAH